MYRVERVTDSAAAEEFRGVLASADRDPDVDGLVRMTARSIEGHRGVAGEWAVWAAVTIDGGEVVGVAEAWNHHAAFTKDASGRPVSTVELIYGSWTRLGTLTRISVAPAHRRRGIARMLTEARLGWLAEQGCSHVMTAATIPRGDDEADQIAGIHVRYGLARLHGFRKPEQIEGCRHCTGRKSCGCETVVMVGPVSPLGPGADEAHHR